LRQCGVIVGLGSGVTPKVAVEVRPVVTVAVALADGLLLGDAPTEREAVAEGDGILLGDAPIERVAVAERDGEVLGDAPTEREAVDEGDRPVVDEADGAATEPDGVLLEDAPIVRLAVTEGDEVGLALPTMTVTALENSEVFPVGPVAVTVTVPPTIQGPEGTEKPKFDGMVAPVSTEPVPRKV